MDSKNRELRLSRSVVGRQEALAVSRIIEEVGYLGMGTEVKLFEEDIANYLGVLSSQVVCVNTGTAALHLAIEAIISSEYLNPQLLGFEVLLPSLTYVASYQAILGAGAVPVSCEVRLKDGLLDLEDAERKITAKTKVILPVHYASNPALIDGVYDLAEKYNLRIIEDAAHAFGCLYQGRKIGSFGDIVCFSFDGIKNITSGEGGAVVTKDKQVLKFVKDARLLSVENDTEKRFTGTRSWEFDVKNRGFRFHMSNIMAAIGRCQLQRLDTEFAVKRRNLALLYRKLLAKEQDIILLDIDLRELVPHIHPVRIINNKREAVKKLLAEKNIPTGMHYKPNHLLTLFGSGSVKLPCAEKLGSELLTLPLHPALEEEDVYFICEELKNSLKQITF